jgi:hypothetical protein
MNYLVTKAKCPECDRVFDLLDDNDDPMEALYGHDCEVEE